MPTIIDVPSGWRARLQVARDQVARDPRLLAVAGAVLLMFAPVLPGLSRLVVLPALLLAPGYAFLRLLGQATGMRSISVAVPVSLVLAVCASLVLDASGIRLGPASLGLLLGAVTAVLLAGSYRRRLGGGRPASPKAPPPRQPPPTAATPAETGAVGAAGLHRHRTDPGDQGPQESVVGRKATHPGRGRDFGTARSSRLGPSPRSPPTGKPWSSTRQAPPS